MIQREKTVEDFYHGIAEMPIPACDKDRFKKILFDVYDIGCDCGYKNGYSEGYHFRHVNGDSKFIDSYGHDIMADGY